jgi:hypothetical protein
MPLRSAHIFVVADRSSRAVAGLEISRMAWQLCACTCDQHLRAGKFALQASSSERFAAINMSALTASSGLAPVTAAQPRSFHRVPAGALPLDAAAFRCRKVLFLVCLQHLGSRAGLEPAGKHLPLTYRLRIRLGRENRDELRAG